MQEATGATTKIGHPGETRTPTISLDLGHLVPDQAPPAGVRVREADTEGTTTGIATAAETDPLSIVIRTNLDSITEAHLVIAKEVKVSVTEATGRNTTTDRTSDRSSSLLTNDSPAFALKVRHGTATILEDHGSGLISD